MVDDNQADAIGCEAPSPVYGIGVPGIGVPGWIQVCLGRERLGHSQSMPVRKQYRFRRRFRRSFRVGRPPLGHRDSPGLT